VRSVVDHRWRQNTWWEQKGGTPGDSRVCH